MRNDEAYRERFEDSNNRFHEAMLAATKAHREGFNLFRETLDRVEERESQLQESVDELKRLAMEQGAQMQTEAAEVRALPERFDSGPFGSARE